MLARHSGFALLLPLVFFLPSCTSSPSPSAGPAPIPPDQTSEELLIHLAGLDPGRAGSYLNEVSRTARNAATGMATMEDTEWMVSLLNQEDWWLSEEPNTRLLNTGGWTQVLAEARQLNPGGGLMTEDQQREQKAYLSSAMVQVFTGDGGAKAKADHESATARQRQIRLQKAEERRLELQEAVKWAQFTRIWSIYYESASPLPAGPVTGPVSPEVALDQAVTMSLQRPDFLERLAAHLNEIMKD
jgi:hypothetical protein